MRHALLLGDPQSPFGIGGGRRRVVAKDVNERGETQRCDEGKRVPERLGGSYPCPQLVEGPIRVTEHPGNPCHVELAIHRRVRTRPILELHLRIEQLEAPPKVRKRRLQFPLS